MRRVSLTCDRLDGVGGRRGVDVGDRDAGAVPCGQGGDRPADADGGVRYAVGLLSAADDQQPPAIQQRAARGSRPGARVRERGGTGARVHRATNLSEASTTARWAGWSMSMSALRATIAVA